MTNPAALTAFVKGDMENFLVASAPGGIQAQEKAGQALLVASTNMPKELRPNREAFERAGFMFGADIDAVFVNATLPNGWSRAATNHDMHSEILDEHGRKRVSVFYKAAFYDRRADARLTNRFYVDAYTGEENEQTAVVVRDAGKEVFRAGTYAPREWEKCKALEAEAEKWLAKRYPDFSDPTAYW